jgi:ABC-type transport system involved in cytochrome c biogenesis permease subunit
MNHIAQVVRTLVMCGVLGYAGAWVCYLRGRGRLGRGLLVLGWLLNLSVFVINGVIAGEPPFGNMYHVLVFLGLCFPPLLAILAGCWKMGWSGGYFAFSAAMALTGAWFMDADVHWRRMPALQSPWFVPHVFSYMVSYALATVAIVMTAVKRLRSLDPEEAARYATTAHRVLRLGFPFMTFGMLSGALWAEEAWGRYWSWDPKETWSLITWTLYLGYLHCRYDRRTAAWADLIQALAFGALLWTFFLVNLLPRLSSALHSYAG